MGMIDEFKRGIERARVAVSEPRLASPDPSLVRHEGDGLVTFGGATEARVRERVFAFPMQVTPRACRLAIDEPAALEGMDEDRAFAALAEAVAHAIPTSRAIAMVEVPIEYHTKEGAMTGGGGMVPNSAPRVSMVLVAYVRRFERERDGNVHSIVVAARSEPPREEWTQPVRPTPDQLAAEAEATRREEAASEERREAERVARSRLIALEEIAGSALPQGEGDRRDVLAFLAKRVDTMALTILDMQIANGTRNPDGTKKERIQ